MAQQQLQIVKEEASLGELFSQLAEQTGRLIRQEAALVQTEVANKASAAGKNVGYIAAGAFVGYAGAMALVAAVIILLSYVVPLWASALLIGAALCVAGYFMVSSGLAALRKTEWAPRETLESIKEDAQWLKKQVD
ncbi:MAG: phage holin family protein [Pyrinomonadaceae bacterium]|nr:phage holin family protein [Pyrinomonadaceae bacterium]